MIERISIEVTNRCGKACSFCYNRSGPLGATEWSAEELVAFALDCAGSGVRAVSFGGGEPLEFAGLFDVLERLDGRIFRSVTTNGLALDADAALLARLTAARPDKVHVSIHFPERESEVERAVRLARALAAGGVRSGVNFLVARSSLAAAERGAAAVRAAGIGNDRIVYLPMRIKDTPTPGAVAAVAGGGPFQSMTCLAGCARSPRFCSIGWDRRVGWCSYTEERAPLREPTFRALEAALDGLGLTFCGGTE